MPTLYTYINVKPRLKNQLIRMAGYSERKTAYYRLI